MLHHAPSSIALALVLAAGTLAPLSQGQDSLHNESQATAASLQSAFLYSTELMLDGEPFWGTADLAFRLYDAADGTEPIAQPLYLAQTEVLNGLITVELDFGIAPVGARDLWLEIVVGDIPISPRTRLTEAAAAGWQVDPPVGIDTSLEVDPADADADDASANDADPGSPSDIRERRALARKASAGAPIDSRTTGVGTTRGSNPAPGRADHTSPAGTSSRSNTNWTAELGTIWTLSQAVGIGTPEPAFQLDVLGDREDTLIGVTNDNTSSRARAIWADNSSPTGYVIEAWAKSRNGQTRALNARTDSNQGTAIYGWATNKTGSAATYGFIGRADGTAGRGIFGNATSTTGSTRGVWGQVESPNGYAAYFTGVAGSRNYFQRGVGIGTPTVTGMLDVAGGIRARGGAPGPSGSSNNGYAFTGGGGDNDSGMFSTTDGTIQFYTNAVEAMRINAARYMGIGTTNPGGPLDVVGSFGGRFLVANNGQGGGGLAGTQLITELRGQGNLGPQHRFQRGNGGNFADVGLNASAEFVVETGDIARVVITGSETRFHTGDGTRRMVINGSGNVSIGTTAGYSDVALNVNYAARPWAIYCDTGNAAKPGGGSWASTSDERLKKNIHTLERALDTILSMRGVTFEYIDPKAMNELEGERIGFVAQEIEQIIPDWVSNGPDGYKRVTIRGFEALAVEAIRELEARNAELEAQNAELADRLEQVEKALRLLGIMP